MLKADLHIHSSYSFDSFSKPEHIVEKAHKAGLDIIAICDHGTIEGAVSARDYNKYNDLQVIIGMEIKSFAGDIVALNINKEIRSTTPGDIINEIHENGGLAVLVHPYSYHDLSCIPVEKFDFIETFNSNCSKLQNKKADALAEKYGITKIAGSDSHFLATIGKGITLLESPELSTGIVKGIEGRSTSITYFLISQLIKRLKRFYGRFQ